MNEKFLIRKEVFVKGSSSLYLIELEVIKEVEGFTLGEILFMNHWNKISLIRVSDIWVNYSSISFMSDNSVYGKSFSRDEFITMEDYRDSKLKEILDNE